MTTTRNPALRARLLAGALAAATALTGCGQDAPTTAPPASVPPGTTGPAEDAAAPDALVLRVAEVGGFSTAGASLARLPVVSVYGDGRVLTTPPPSAPAAPAGAAGTAGAPDEGSAEGAGGPDAPTAPGALPTLVVHQVGPDGAASLVRRARGAGVGSEVDAGRPPIADATTTRFTVVVDGAERTTEVYALRETASGAGGLPPGVEAGPAGGLDAAQADARRRLADVRAALTDVGTTLGEGAGDATPYAPSALAVLASPLAGAGDGAQALAWPGPALPGAQTGAPGTTCVVAQGAALGPALDAAAGAAVGRAWSWGGSTWSLAFRPLLPDESGCEDILG